MMDVLLEQIAGHVERVRQYEEECKAWEEGLSAAVQDLDADQAVAVLHDWLQGETARFDVVRKVKDNAKLVVTYRTAHPPDRGSLEIDCIKVFAEFSTRDIDHQPRWVGEFKKVVFHLRRQVKNDAGSFW